MPYINTKYKYTINMVLLKEPTINYFYISDRRLFRICSQNDESTVFGYYVQKATKFPNWMSDDCIYP